MSTTQKDKSINKINKIYRDKLLAHNCQDHNQILKHI